MNKKRSGSMSASDNSADVSAKNKSRSSLYDFFNAAGTSSIEFMRSICRIFLNASRFIGLEILNVIKRAVYKTQICFTGLIVNYCVIISQ